MSTALARYTYCYDSDYKTGDCTTPPPSTTTPPPIAQPTVFKIAGSVTTTKVLVAPTAINCSTTRVLYDCISGSQRARTCCTAPSSTCDAIFMAAIQNCNNVAYGSYSCEAGADREDCCRSIFAAYFNGPDACSA
ncbi:hypothetical protein JCM10207_001109 [Rhodosporidiobolus poonsookiae]